jgi:hypothetical protein
VERKQLQERKEFVFDLEKIMGDFAILEKHLNNKEKRA